MRTCLRLAMLLGINGFLLISLKEGHITYTTLPYLTYDIGPSVASTAFPDYRQNE